MGQLSQMISPILRITCMPNFPFLSKNIFILIWSDLHKLSELSEDCIGMTKVKLIQIRHYSISLLMRF